METDVVYFTRRASEERAAAAKAQHALARQSHLEMAARFEELAEAIVRRARILGIEAASADA